mgnify:CR=1 FL=1
MPDVTVRVAVPVVFGGNTSDTDAMPSVVLVSLGTMPSVVLTCTGVPSATIRPVGPTTLALMFVALPQVAEAARGMTVILDGGVRRGTDVLKALALGADFVFLGRPFLYAASVGGEAGVRHAIELLSSEVGRDMALMGVSDLSEVRPELLTKTRG